MRYRTIVADPPWRYIEGKHSGLRGTAETHYPTMAMWEIVGLPVDSLSHDDAHLYLWVTNPVLTEQRTKGLSPNDIARAWGFEPKTILTWVKDRIGLGHYYRGQTEHVIFAVRGRAPIPESLRKSNVVRGPVRAHSQKPDSFYDLVELVSPEPRLEMFARRQRLGWDTWGNEALCHVDLDGNAA